MSLVLPASHRAEIRRHLERAYPEEGCGVLLGRDAKEGREIGHVVPLENGEVEGRARRYLIPPERLLAVEKQGRDAGLEVVGFFHSHPDQPAEPSRFDLERAWPYYSYLIVTVRQGQTAEMRSWRLADDGSRFVAEPLENERP